MRTLWLLICLQLTGCGYALVGRGSTLPEDVRDIFVRPLENRTQREQVEQFLTQSIADELLTRKRFRLVASPGEADAVLQGTVKGFSVTPVTFDQDGRATEYEISITADMSFQRLDTEEVLWDNDNYLFRELYEIDQDEQTFFDRENIAIEGSAVRFAETIVSDLLEGF